MKFSRVRFVACAGVLTLGMAAATPVQAADFSGKKIKLVVPFGEGGDGDRYGRLWQPFLEKYLPGNSTVLVVNKPGGGGIKGNNWFEQNAKPDGTMAIVSSTSTYTAFLFGGEKVKFNVLNWRAVIASPLGTQYVAHTKTGVTGKDIVADVKVLQKGKWFAGGKTPTSAEMHQFLTYYMLGIDHVTPVLGLSASGRRKAIFRGELKLNYHSTGVFLNKVQLYIKKGILAHYMSFGFVTPGGKIVRDPAFPEMPNVWDAYKALNGGNMRGPGERSLRHFLNMATMASKALLLPKGTPRDVLQAYVLAVKKTLKNKKFRKISKKELGDYPQSLGKNAEAIIQNAVNVEPTTRKWLKNWIQNKFDVSF